MIRKERKVFDLMSKEKEDILKKGKKFFLLVSIIVLSCSIIHGQESIISNGYLEADVYGNGSGANGTDPFDQAPDNNKISIVGAAKVKGKVYGARNGNPEVNVTNNTAVIDTTRHITGSVYGGWSNGVGAAVSNTVTMEKGNISNDAIGGNSEGGVAERNKVEIKGGTIAGSVIGGDGYSGTYENVVQIERGSVKAVAGGKSWDGEVAENKVEIKGGTIRDNIYGGWAFGRRNVSSNKVTISNGEIKKDVVGGKSKDGEVAENEVKITGGTLSNLCEERGDLEGTKMCIEQNVYGGNSISGSAKKNKVTIEVDIGWNVYKLYDVDDMMVASGTVGGLICGGKSEEGEAVENEVEVKRGTVRRDVIGGWSLSTGTVSMNTVAISAGDITGNVIGGKSSGSAISNTVTISNGNIKG
jgi:hypothetical protein